MSASRTKPEMAYEYPTSKMLMQCSMVARRSVKRILNRPLHINIMVKVYPVAHSATRMMQNTKKRFRPFFKFFSTTKIRR